MRPDFNTEKELNKINPARWKQEFNKLKRFLMCGNLPAFNTGIDKIVQKNHMNPTIGNIFYKASTVIAEFDLKQSLKYYIHYVYMFKKSPKVSIKPIPNTIKEIVFDTYNQRLNTKKFIKELAYYSDIEDAYEQIDQYFASKMEGKDKIMV